MIERTCACLIPGKNSIIRPSVSAASTVCSVDITRWPDSAAWSAVIAFGVAELTDEDHVRVLRSAPAGPRRTMRVQPDLALVDDAADVVAGGSRSGPRGSRYAAGVAVDVAEHRRERRRLPRAGGARDEDEAAVLLGERAPPGGRLTPRRTAPAWGWRGRQERSSPAGGSPLTRKRGGPAVLYAMSRSPSSRKPRGRPAGAR